MQTKAAKTFRTYFMPVDEGALGIVGDWVRELERDHLWRRGDPLFPATEMGLARGDGFVPVGLLRHAMTLGLSPEETKAWSQNLGHADMLTTFTSYEQAPTHRQGELIRGMGESRAIPSAASREEVAVFERMLARVRGG